LSWDNGLPMCEAVVHLTKTASSFIIKLIMNSAAVPCLVFLPVSLLQSNSVPEKLICLESDVFSVVSLSLSLSLNIYTYLNKICNF
jgi:hypothetical protein